MGLIIADQRLDEKCEKALADRGYEIVKLSGFGKLQEPISSHPDMLMFIGKGKLFCHREYYGKEKEKLDRIAEESGAELVLSDEKWEKDYPNDVLFNAVCLGDKLICCKKSVSKLILSCFDEENIVDTKQGYTKCSTVAVGDSAIITADPSIQKSCSTSGIDVLFLSGNFTSLDGYDTGFIGGASGTDGENIYFCGDISKHPDGDRIIEFCKNHRKSVISLSEEPLYDYGSLFFV